MLGLYHYLVKKGHNVTPVSPGELPEFLMWMPGVRQLINYEEDPELAKAALQKADYIFCLDCNQYARTKPLTQLLEDAPQP